MKKLLLLPLCLSLFGTSNIAARTVSVDNITDMKIFGPAMTIKQARILVEVTGITEHGFEMTTQGYIHLDDIAAGDSKSIDCDTTLLEQEKKKQDAMPERFKEQTGKEGVITEKELKSITKVRILEINVEMADGRIGTLKNKDGFDGIGFIVALREGIVNICENYEGSYS